MRILHILKTEPDEIIQSIIDVQKKNNEVYIIELKKDISYEETVDLIFNCDRVFTW